MTNEDMKFVEIILSIEYFTPEQKKEIIIELIKNNSYVYSSSPTTQYPIITFNTDPNLKYKT